jgi:DNA-binding SARP family transcriptional activator
MRGLSADVIAELQRLTGAHPLREHLHAQLMLAFYRTSRQGEALAACSASPRIGNAAEGRLETDQP